MIEVEVVHDGDIDSVEALVETKKVLVLAIHFKRLARPAEWTGWNDYFTPPKYGMQFPDDVEINIRGLPFTDMACEMTCTDDVCVVTLMDACILDNGRRLYSSYERLVADQQAQGSEE